MTNGFIHVHVLLWLLLWLLQLRETASPPPHSSFLDHANVSPNSTQEENQEKKEGVLEDYRDDGCRQPNLWIFSDLFIHSSSREDQPSLKEPVKISSSQSRPESKNI